MFNQRLKKPSKLAAIALALLLSISGASSIFAAPAQQTTVDAVVKSDGNLHAGPSPLYNEVGEVSEGTSITLVGQTPYQTWYQLESEEWISIDLLTEMPSQLPYVAAPPSNASNSQTGGSSMADEDMADEDMADEDMADEDMADEDMADEDMADEDMADEDMADEDMADEDMADEDMADEDMADEDAADEDMADEGAADEAADEDMADEDAADEDMADEEMAAPEAMVTIPSGWTTIEDAERGYSYAVPSSWTELDLRGSQISTLANAVGQGAAVTQLQDFLDTPEGQSVGSVAVSVADLTNVLSGGLPTLLNVSVISAPGVTADNLLNYVEQILELNSAMLGDVSILNLEATTTNNLPSVVGTATADLSSVGMNAEAAAKVAALIHDEQIFMISLGTRLDNWSAAEPVFDDIIGTLMPE